MRTRRYTNTEWRKKAISKNGAALTEFALVAVVFFILFFGVIDMSRLMLMYHHVGNAAREGTRFAIVHGNTSLTPASDADIENYIKTHSPLDPNNVNVYPTWEYPTDRKPGSWVSVRVEYPFTFLLPFWFGSPITLTSTSQMVISY